MRFLARSLLILSFVFAAACGSTENEKDKGVSQDDQFVCKYPTNISFCDPPPNKASTTKWYCWGCNCAGPTSVAACNGQTGDCRFFADGCYPTTYSLCDKNATDKILGLCGYCFFQEAGPAQCDKLIDLGGAGAKDGGK